MRTDEGTRPEVMPISQSRNWNEKYMACLGRHNLWRKLV